MKSRLSAFVKFITSLTLGLKWRMGLSGGLPTQVFHVWINNTNISGGFKTDSNSWNCMHFLVMNKDFTSTHRLKSKSIVQTHTLRGFSLWLSLLSTNRIQVCTRSRYLLTTLIYLEYLAGVKKREIFSSHLLTEFLTDKMVFYTGAHKRWDGWLIVIIVVVVIHVKGSKEDPSTKGRS